jgi:hypothetical protein
MSVWTPFPLVYQINTRVWLAKLSRELGKPITLADVPEAEFQKWSDWNCDAIWAMGVWKASHHSRHIALNHPGLKRDYSQVLSDWKEEDIVASPYSIADYQVSDSLGGDVALAKFRANLQNHGMKLILDFVPNHTAVEFPWVQSNPEFYVQVPPNLKDKVAKEDFFNTSSGAQIACGRDPNYPAWTDTLQLNYGNASLQSALKDLLKRIASQCDGIRCDMAMLVLKDVFNRTWKDWTTPMQAEFWDNAIVEVKKSSPDFLFMAEAYWDLEWQLQQLGFDFTYDKRLYDRLKVKDSSGARLHLNADWDFARRLVRFTENHDEERSAAAFGDGNRATWLLTMTLPGLRLMHQGQHEGWQTKIPVQMIRGPEEKTDEEIAVFARKFFKELRHPAITHGDFGLLEVEGNRAHAVLAFHRRHKEKGSVLVAVNLTHDPQDVRLSTDVFDTVQDHAEICVVNTERWGSPRFDLIPGGVKLSLRPYEAALFILHLR